MIKKDTVLYYAKNREDDMFLSGIYDDYIKAYTTSKSIYSGFMSERKQQILKNAFSSEKNIRLSFYGGFDRAERKIACFHTEEDNNYPYTVLKVSVKGKDKLSHRDFLGALMSLGIRRDIVGDILIGEEILIFVKSEMADYIITNLTSVARKSVSVEAYSGNAFPKLNDGVDFFETVASLRLDAVVSCGFNIARDKAKKLISQGRCFVNSEPVLSCDGKLSEGDKISIKGFGRIVLKEIKGLSKKGRIILNINKQA